MHSLKEFREILKFEGSLAKNAKRLALIILHQKDTPDQIARGVALGLFIAFAIPPGLQIVAALAVAVVLRCNTLAACLMVFVSNPLTMPFIYPLAFYLGSAVTGVPVQGSYPTSDEGFWALTTNIWKHGRVLVLIMVGCFTLGAVSSIIGFYASKGFVRAYRRRHP